MKNIRSVGNTGPGEPVYATSSYGDDAVETDSWLFFEDDGDEWEFVPEQPDNVNHPSHYTSHPSGVECITIVRHYNFNVGGAIKYLWRNGLKDEDAQIEDLQKAVWLIQDEIKRLQETASNGDLTAGYYV